MSTLLLNFCIRTFFFDFSKVRAFPYSSLLYLFLIHIIISLSYEENIITLTVIGSGGKVKIIDEDCETLPDEITVNGEIQTLDENNQITVGSTVTTVKFSWSDDIIDFYAMFYEIDSIISVDFSEFSCTGIDDMRAMFAYCTNLKSINFANFDSSSVTSMYGLFAVDINLLEVDLSKLDVSSVKDMTYMFYESGIRNIDLKNFRTSSLMLMISMFEECHNLKSIDLSMFDTTNVIDMYSLFYNDDNLEVVNLSNLNNPVLADISLMFAYCTNLTDINLTGFHTPNVENMTKVFSHCESLTSIDISSLINVIILVL